MKKRVFITIFIVLIVIILLGMYKFNYLSNQDGYDVDGNKNKIEVDNTQDKKEDVTEKKYLINYAIG